jgi:hypothetical protein
MIFIKPRFLKRRLGRKLLTAILGPALVITSTRFNWTRFLLHMGKAEMHRNLIEKDHLEDRKQLRGSFLSCCYQSP